jgi:protein-disulfide isomerase
MQTKRFYIFKQLLLFLFTPLSVCVLALAFAGCKDPYKDQPAGLPPGVGKSETSGTLQQVYQAPAASREPARRTATTPVSRQKVPIGKDPSIYGNPDAPITLVEYSNFQ